jgi:diketogulonate reductase-like aldo/keto reductase
MQDTLTAYRTLETYVNAGKVRMLGISNCYDPNLLQWLIGEVTVPISVVQNRYVLFSGLASFVSADSFDQDGTRTTSTINTVNLTGLGHACR